MGDKGTSLWEMWENSSRSLDHYFLGTYEEWFFSGLAGIRDVKEGYKTFSIKPNVANDLSYVNSSVNTVRGKITSKWNIKADGKVIMIAEVPVGSTAKIYLPTNRQDGIVVNDVAAASAQGVKSVTSTEGSVVVIVGSGKYIIKATCTDRLKSDIRSTEGLDKMKYKQTSWNDFKLVIDQAKTVLNNNSLSTQTDIQTMRTELSAALITLNQNIDSDLNN